MVMIVVMRACTSYRIHVHSAKAGYCHAVCGLSTHFRLRTTLRPLSEHCTLNTRLASARVPRPNTVFTSEHCVRANTVFGPQCSKTTHSVPREGEESSEV
jgi:hypothetical protein